MQHRKTSDEVHSNALVVDDQPSTAMLVDAILSRAGFRVDECGSGREAMLAMSATAYDLIVLDVSLPDMSALDLLRDWKAGKLPPVLGMTSGVTPELVERAAVVGMNRILEKPVSGAQLIASATAAIHDARALQILTCDGPALDILVLAEARASSGQERFARFVEQALADAWQCLSMLESEMSHGVALWQRHAHALDGVARSLGARRLTHFLADALLLPEAHFAAASRGLTMQLIDLMSEVQQAIGEWMHIDGIHPRAEAGAVDSESSSAGLSGREREVLRWTAVGKTTSEIAGLLGIAGRTVTYHVTNILFKLGCANKTQAVAKAMILGLIR